MVFIVMMAACYVGCVVNAVQDGGKTAVAVAATLTVLVVIVTREAVRQRLH